jgi:squalene monooxygenase
MSLQDRIVGELLQPGGVRALERLGLDDCAKEGIDSVGVDGYVVFTPNKGNDAVRTMV